MSVVCIGYFVLQTREGWCPGGVGAGSAGTVPPRPTSPDLQRSGLSSTVRVPQLDR
jgi:hypothetical protein